MKFDTNVSVQKSMLTSSVQSPPTTLKAARKKDYAPNSRFVQP